jgi:hypothetical protein
MPKYGKGVNMPTEYGNKDKDFGIEIDNKKNRDFIEKMVKKSKPIDLDVPISVYIPKVNIFKRIWSAICGFFRKKYREIRYKKIASVPEIKNGLITIPMDRVTDKNAEEVGYLSQKIARTNNLGRGTFCIKHKSKGRVIIDMGTFDDMRRKYGDEYEIVESEIK